MRKRNIEKTLYLSEKEYELLNKKCQELVLTKSEYIRQLVNNYQSIKTNVDILEKHKAGLDKIGNSLNYLIRRLEYKKGEIGCSLGTLYRISIVLGVTMDKFFE